MNAVSNAATARAPNNSRRRWFTPEAFFFAAAALIIYLGWYFPTDRYITPERGIGYALGILGGSLMLVLLLYPAR
jgi:hypothetical protein